jgi:hypothetical protein
MAAMAGTMAATDTTVTANRSAAADSRRAGRRRGSPASSDRLTVALVSVATFLVVLALLVHQLPATSYARSSPVHLLRKIYRTTVVETIAGGSGPGGSSVSQSVSSSGSNATTAAPTTRTS